jgi:hypothetical protein
VTPTVDEDPEEQRLPPPPPGLSQRPAYQQPAPPPTPQTSRAGILTLVGGVLVLISVFLPWVTVKSSLGSGAVSEFGGGGFGLLILGGFAIARGVSMTRIGGFGFRLGSPLIGGILMIVLLVLRWNEIRDAIDRIHAVYPTVDVGMGIGFWGAVLGAALVLAGGAIAMQHRR